MPRKITRLRPIEGSPSKSAVRFRTTTIRRLREPDFRAAAIAIVMRDGTVHTSHCGAEDGFWTPLKMGAEILRRRVREGD